MGPFSNNAPSRSPNNRSGNKLPTPDVNATGQQTVVIEAPEDHSKALQKWFLVTMWIIGGMVAAGLVVFVAFMIVSNTPGYMLGVATNKLITSGGTAGSFTYETGGKRGTSTTHGDFVVYGDPADPQKSAAAISFGQGAARVGVAARFMPGANYMQTAGLGNLKRLFDGAKIDSSNLTNDDLVRLSSLDGQWYSLTADDAIEVGDIVKQHTLKGALHPSDVTALGRLYEKRNFITVLQQYGDEPVNAVPSMHVQLGIDKSKLTAFLRSVKDANLASINITDTDIADIERINWDQFVFEAWISRGDKTFQQWRVTSKQANDIATTTINFRPGDVATERQSVQAPDNLRSITVLVRSLDDILNHR